ncbi:MAG TPA: small ribosomal subunit Rsm22 family protein [Nitrospirota bacterium]|nr:small ribosomal subunit Rsm22 family protein [Nitrospirota bacterium]
MEKPDPQILSLAESVKQLSKLLTSDRESLPAAYLKDPQLRTAYLRYYLPANMKKVHLALTDLSLHPEWLLSRPRLRVLDLGAGPGTALLGLLAFFAQRQQRPSITCVAVDRVAENLRIAEDLFNSYRTNKKLDASLKTIRGDIESAEFAAEEPFDLVIFSNVLNELFPFDEDRTARRIDIVNTALSKSLAEGGSCIIIEPALRETSRDLLEVRDGLLQQGFFVFSPCLIGTKCPACENPRDWCHEDIPWDPPQLIKQIDKLAGLRKDSLKFSYLVLRKDSRSLSDMFGPDAYRVVSEPLITKGKIEFYLCGLEGRKLVTRLDKDRSPLNVHFEKLSRGAIVSFERLRNEGTRFKVEQLTEVIIHKHLQ